MKIRIIKSQDGLMNSCTRIMNVETCTKTFEGDSLSILRSLQMQTSERLSSNLSSTSFLSSSSFSWFSASPSRSVRFRLRPRFIAGLAAFAESRAFTAAAAASTFAVSTAVPSRPLPLKRLPDTPSRVLLVRFVDLIRLRGHHFPEPLYPRHQHHLHRPFSASAAPFSQTPSNPRHDEIDAFLTSLDDTGRAYLFRELTTNSDEPLPTTASEDEQHQQQLAAAAVEEEGAERRPTQAQLQSACVYSLLPFVAFGFVDNAVMIVAGDYIDATVGVTLGISVLAAAGLGFVVVDMGAVFVSNMLLVSL